MREKRTAGADAKSMPPGPYLAEVVSHLDGRRSGTLQVQLVKTATAGADDKEVGQLYTVKYCMPFYGVTDVRSNRADNRYSSSQQSYGFWAVPPDPGTKVLVIFAEGKANQGYWIGCVQDEYMNFMVPGGYPTAKSEYVIQEALTDEFKNKPLPSGEYNKILPDRKGNDPDKFLKPHNPLMVNTLGAQGLIDDPIRGLTSTSSRRDIPSTVFGWNTPGPLDKRDGAPKGKYGAKRDQVDYFRSRLGGSAFTMDDGDPTILRAGLASDTEATYYDIENNSVNLAKADKTILFNEHVRLRTRTGHQILLHNSEDLIYIGNARGSAWIELTSNGKIDIFTDDSISVRTANDINFHADRDINLSATRNVNINAGQDMKTTVAGNMDTKVGVDAKLDVAANYDTFVGVDNKVYVGANGHLLVKGNQKISVDSNIDITAGASRKDKQATYDLFTTGNNKLTAGGNTEILTTGEHRESASEIHMNSGANAAGTAAEAELATNAEVAAFALYPRRVPQREPWPEHENLNPSAHTAGETEAILSPPYAVRDVPTFINSEADQPQYTGESGPVTANSALGKDNPQVVVPGTTGPSAGDQPAHPVDVNDMQRYMLDQLIKAINLSVNDADPTKVPIGMSTGNAQALGMAMAQVQAECSFKPRSESMNYSAKRLRQVFPNRVKTDQFARELVAAGQAAIGNTLYGGRYGNAKDEGYKYRGRGLIQLTFKANYEKYGKLANVDVVNNPEMANDPEVATKLAVAYLKSKSIPWDSYDFNALGEAFRKAVGYANQGGAETARRIRLGKGFYAKIISGELTPLGGLSTTEYPETGETTVQ